MYPFPLGAVTNDNTLCGLKEHTWIKRSGGQMSEVSLTRLKSRRQQSWFLLVAPERRIHSCLFQHLEAAGIPRLVATSVFKTSIFKSLPHLHTASSSACGIISCLPPPSEDPCWSRLIPDHLPISRSLTSLHLFPPIRSHSQVFGIKANTYLRGGPLFKYLWILLVNGCKFIMLHLSTR